MKAFNILCRGIRRAIAMHHKFSDALYACVLKKPCILGLLETVELIQKKRVSVARFGDGEMALMLGGNLNFQEYDPRLADKLAACIRSNLLLVCLPDVFGSLTKYTKRVREFWSNEMCLHRRQWYGMIDWDIVYGNAFISRFYLAFQNKEHVGPLVSMLKGLWKDRDLIVVEGAYSRLGVGNDLFVSAASVKRILVPAKNAFRRYDEIVASACLYNKSHLFILAAGPTATVLALDLTILGYQAIDLGHVDLQYEWSLRNSTEKVAIAGKFCNETFLGGKIGAEVEGCLSEKDEELYLSQICEDLSDL